MQKLQLSSSPSRQGIRQTLVHKDFDTILSQDWHCCTRAEDLRPDRCPRETIPHLRRA